MSFHHQLPSPGHIPALAQLGGESVKARPLSPRAVSHRVSSLVVSAHWKAPPAVTSALRLVNITVLGRINPR